jgi:hypothetical protein
MAAASGISLRSVQRIWAAHGLQPHRVRRFKLSHDPAFAAKLRDVVGLYLDPPASWSPALGRRARLREDKGNGRRQFRAVDLVITVHFDRFGMDRICRVDDCVRNRHASCCLSRNMLSMEGQVKINQMLIGLSLLPLLAGVATAAQPALLSDSQMDKVTAGSGAPPAGFVIGTIALPTLAGDFLGTGGAIPFHITYALFSDCTLCNAALAAIAPLNP